MAHSPNGSAPEPGRGARPAAGLIFILTTVWIDVLSWGVTLPVYPRLIQNFTKGDVGKAAAIMGVLTTVFFGVQLFAAPVLGALSDRYGRRPVILAASLGLSVDLLAMVWMVFRPSLWVMVVTRIVHAVTAAIGPMAMAYIADVTPQEHRARAFGRYLAVFNTGIVVGPALGGLLGAVALWAPFAAGGVFALLNTAYGLFALPESLGSAQRRPLELRAANPFGAVAFLRVDATLAVLATALFLVMFANQFWTIWALYAAFRYGWGTMDVGLSFAFIGCIGGLVQFFAVEPTVRRIGERWAMVLGVSLFISALIIFGLANSAILFLAGHVLLCLGGLGTPAYNAVMSRRIDADRQGEFQGAMGALQGFAGLIGPLVFSGCFAYVTAPGALLPLTGAPFFIGALLAAGALALTFRALSGRRWLEDPAPIGLNPSAGGE
jgi:DHA1 family tetracycline resistance protein-like MFS transporter